jgi:hypothetical protein
MRWTVYAAVAVIVTIIWVSAALLAKLNVTGWVITLPIAIVAWLVGCAIAFKGGDRK